MARRACHERHIAQREWRSEVAEISCFINGVFYRGKGNEEISSRKTSEAIIWPLTMVVCGCTFKLRLGTTEGKS
jgi:hypothetical protein